jgi:hypothetical protein
LFAQRDILSGIAVQRDQQQWDAQDRQWVQGVVKDFMEPLFDALAGNGTYEWKRTFGEIKRMEDRLVSMQTHLSSGEFDTFGPTLYGSELSAANAMARTHITVDLRRALINNGVGDDEKWATIGSVVNNVMTFQYGVVITGAANIVGRLYPELDPNHVRDTMRDALNRGGMSVPKYVDPIQ